MGEIMMASTARRRTIWWSQNRDLVFLAGAAILIVGIASALSPSFRSVRNLINLLNQMAPLGLAALAQTLPILTTGIDLSIGSVMSMATALAATQMTGGIWIGLALVLAIGTLTGLVNGVVIARLRLEPLIVTLAVSSVVGGATLLVLPYPGGLVPRTFVSFLTTRLADVVPISFVFLIAAALVLWFIMSYTPFGRGAYALGGDRTKARVAGIHVDRITVGVYVLAGVLAACAGLVLAARMRSGDPLSGVPFTLDSVAAVVIGGTNFTGGRGHVVGTLMGVMVVSVLRVALNLLGISPFYQDVASGVIVVVAVLYASLR